MKMKNVATYFIIDIYECSLIISNLLISWQSDFVLSTTYSVNSLLFKKKLIIFIGQ